MIIEDEGWSPLFRPESILLTSFLSEGLLLLLLLPLATGLVTAVAVPLTQRNLKCVWL